MVWAPLHLDPMEMGPMARTRSIWTPCIWTRWKRVCVFGLDGHGPMHFGPTEIDLMEMGLMFRARWSWTAEVSAGGDAPDGADQMDLDPMARTLWTFTDGFGSDDFGLENGPIV